MSVDQTGNRYSVHVADGDQGWEVRIEDPDREPVWSRPCATESDARTLASTVQQHAYWLSEAKFREYYRLPGAVA